MLLPKHITEIYSQTSVKNRKSRPHYTVQEAKKRLCDLLSWLAIRGSLQLLSLALYEPVPEAPQFVHQCLDYLDSAGASIQLYILFKLYKSSIFKTIQSKAISTKKKLQVSTSSPGKNVQLPITMFYGVLNDRSPWPFR